MKAFLLAAGFGTRLKPITDNTAKCLVPIQGKALLQWWFELLRKYDVDEVLINTHYLSNQVEGFVNKYCQNNDYKVITAYEEKLLGSGGTIKKNSDFVDEQEDFFICYADNLTNINLTELHEFHKKNKGLITMALFRTTNPEQCGVVSLDSHKRIVDFVEKPNNPKSNLVNAGIYITNKTILNYFPEKEFVDFGKDVLPQLIGEMYGYEIKEYLIDIGTISNYKKAQKEWKDDYYTNTF